MKKGIFYATSTGNTREVAFKIAKALGIPDADVHDVAVTAPDAVGRYDLIIMGSPTYGSGELQPQFSDFLDGVSVLNLKGRKVAVFGLGDESMTDTFCNAVGEIYKRMKATGAEMEGAFPTYPYEFDHSEAVPVQGAEAEGLLIDLVNHPEVTDSRIADWVKTL